MVISAVELILLRSYKGRAYCLLQIYAVVTDENNYCAVKLIAAQSQLSAETTTPKTDTVTQTILKQIFTRTI